MSWTVHMKFIFAIVYFVFFFAIHSGFFLPLAMVYSFPYSLQVYSNELKNVVFYNLWMNAFFFI